jgi:anti-sigma factor RsiW
MTDCTGTLTDRCLERYIQGTLPEHEAQQFEEHYFGCPDCLAQVEALQAVTRRLGALPRTPARAPIPWPVRVSALAAIAAMLVIGFIVFRVKRAPLPEQAVATVPAAPVAKAAPAPSLTAASVSRLADLTLPAFQARTLRGQNGDPNFDSGMKAYTRRDCSSAVKALARVPANDEDSLAARFFVGVCQMHDGSLGAATTTLESVANAGDSPQQEAALYYLAQVALERGDADAARHYLTRTVALRGDFESRARAELVKIR